MSEPKRPGLTYRDAGVDIDAQDEGLRRIKAMLHATRTEGVLADLGSFGGMFRPDLSGMEEPVLVASCDGVGTKLKVAHLAGVHHTIGRDLVNHCVNDILVQGAKPLFFLDYLATGKLSPQVMARIVEGVAAGCRENGCALLGGETAEMPGFYGAGEYDVAGFIVGIVDRKHALTGAAIRPGDLLVALPSEGLHTNGYSLARKIFFEVAGKRVSDQVDGLPGTIGDVLLAPHRSYLTALAGPLKRGLLRGLAHITGGGLTDNVPRILPEGRRAVFFRSAIAVPPLFTFMQEAGKVADEEMWRTFKMGVGMVLAVSPGQAEAVRRHLQALHEPVTRIGVVEPGPRGVEYRERP